jgi:2,4-dienoyl-CoA reductase-like NADH-dependent reductase (Old Yellow Enzyme family)
MTSLFSPLTLRGLTIRNRIWVSPMCQYSAVEGMASDWHEIHIGSLATGGAGLIMMEAAGVSPEGRISTQCLGLWNDAQAEQLRPILEFAHSQGAALGVQLAHAGRKGSLLPPWSEQGLVAGVENGGWECVAPSPISFGGKYPIPRELSQEEIKILVTAFASAAKRVVDLGFDLVEIHAAHGYLIHQFLSPISNKREDHYGGSFENRIRFLVEITDAIREVIASSTPLFVRISATDWLEEGWTGEDSVQLCKILKEHGVDLIDVSSGGSAPAAPVPVGPGYQVPLAEQIKKQAGIPTSAVGLITNAHQADEIITSNHADAVMMGRQFLRNPRWPLQAAMELGQEVLWPPQLMRGKL